MNLPDSIVVNVHVDSGHAYFEVATDLVSALGVPVSQYSFISPDRKVFYLECDIDAERLIHALTHHHISFRFEPIDHDGLAFFRQYQRALDLH